jgi:hypothetical protein
MKHLIAVLLFTFTQAISADDRVYDPSGYPAMLPDDPRLVRSSTSPEWLAAVGRQVIHLDDKGSAKQCTVALVADQIGKEGIIIVGAGHCAVEMGQFVLSDPHPEASAQCSEPIKTEQRFREDVGSWVTSDCYEYRSGPKDSITFRTSTGEEIKRRIEVVFNIGMTPGDYFIGRLDKAIPYSKIKPLLNSPFDYTDMLREFPFPAFATIAGFSADTGYGQKGKVLTYDQQCVLTGGRSGGKLSYCYSYEGASGGPVAITIDFSSANPNWEDDCDCMTNDEYFEFFTDDFPRLERKSYTFWVGSVVGGRANDTFDRTLWIDSTHYTRILDKILAAH